MKIFIKSILLFSVMIFSLSVHAVEYRLAMSKDDKLCSYVKNNYGKAEFFSGINWKKMPVYIRFTEKSEYSVFDIDNDGEDDLVVRIKQIFHQTTLIDSIAIHDKNSVKIDKNYTNDIFFSANRIISETASGYELDEFNETDKSYPKITHRVPYYSNWVRVVPFLYSSKVYLALQDSLKRPRSKWLLIAKYEDVVLTESDTNDPKKYLTDKCYIEIVNNKTGE